MTSSNTNQDTIRRILLSSPPGQFDIILEDLRKLLQNESSISLLESKFITSVRTEWEAASGRSILTKNNNTDDDGGGGSYDEWCKTILSKAMDGYLSQKFSSPGVRAAHTIMTSSTTSPVTNLTINTYAERIDMHNSHVGSWKGQYTICPSSGTLSGNVVLCAHTFENGGNVQLNSNITLKEVNVGICSSSLDTEKQTLWSKSVIRQIESWEETDVMSNLTTLYDDVSKTYIKNLRRAMPITRCKMEWNVLAHRVVQTLGEGHDKEKFKH